IVNVVQACHFMGVMHRDIKPENFLFSSNDENAMLKAIDFRCADFIKEEPEEQMLYEIQNAPIDFESHPWPCISSAATDLVKKMLIRNPKKRITAAKFLGNMNKLKKVALTVMAKNLSEEEIKGLKTTFNNINTDKSGTVTPEELKRGLTTLGSKVSETEVKQLIEAQSTLDVLSLSKKVISLIWSKPEEQMLYEIENAPIDFESHPWPCISSAATDLVKKMLIRNPKKRITAAKFLGNMNKLKKVALTVMAKNLSEEEIKGLKTTFNNINTDKSGTVTPEELKRGLTTLGSKVSETEVKQLIEAKWCSGNRNRNQLETGPVKKTKTPSFLSKHLLFSRLNEEHQKVVSSIPSMTPNPKKQREKTENMRR
ncbi:hypothetical protein F2Q68_00020533, partial [Brassica cretica]